MVLHPLKVQSTSHTLEMLNYFTFCDPVRQELTGHLRLLVWGARILEAQSCGFNLKYQLQWSAKFHYLIGNCWNVLQQSINFDTDKFYCRLISGDHFDIFLAKLSFSLKILYWSFLMILHAYKVQNNNIIKMFFWARKGKIKPTTQSLLSGGDWAIHNIVLIQTNNNEDKRLL